MIFIFIFLQPRLLSRITATPSMFSAPAPSPVENFDDRSMEEPELLDIKKLQVIFVSVAHHARLLFRS